MNENSHQNRTLVHRHRKSSVFKNVKIKLVYNRTATKNIDFVVQGLV